jgi:small-conductance mechanosensitive channel
MAETTLDRKSPAEIQDTIATIMKMVLLGTLFAAVGYLLILGALFLELTQFHPLLEEFFSSFTNHSLAGGGPDRAGQGALNAQLTEIHKFPSTLLWMKLGGIGHILVGIFIVLAGIIRALALMPHRLSYELEKLQA